MSAAAPVADGARRYVDAFEEIAPRLRGDERLRALRRRALERFAQSGFPTTRNEQWKYTNLRPLERREFSSAPAAGTPAPAAQTLPFSDAGFPTLAFVNGAFVESLSRVQNLPNGLLLSWLDAVLEERPEALAPWFAEATEGERPDAFAALNTAFANDGAVVEVAAGTHVPAPIHLLFISQRADNSVVSHPRIVIMAEPGSEVTVIEHHIGLDDAVNFTNSFTQIELRDNAVVHLYKLQEESAKGFHIGNTFVRQGRDSRYVSHSFDFGGLLARNDLRVNFGGENAEAMLDGLFVLGDRQHCDNHIYADHMTPRTRSRQRYKGVIDGHARGVFSGKVLVAPEAQKIDASQSSNNLLLSEHAEIDTKPELEIYADDVKCSHGATVGQLDETALFYLRSRGLGAAEARELLTVAFANDMLAAIDVEPVRQYLQAAIHNRLNASQGGETS